MNKVIRLKSEKEFLKFINRIDVDIVKIYYNIDNILKLSDPVPYFVVYKNRNIIAIVNMFFKK